MTEYDIGGGKKIQIPDNLDVETRLKLAEVIKDEYGIDINQTSALEQAKEFGKAIPRGIASLALDVPTGIVGLFDIGNDSNLYKGLEGLQDRLRQDSALAADPRYADKFSTKLGEGVGSFVPFLGAGMVGRALAKAPGAAKGFLSPTFTAPTALAIPTGIAAQGDRLQMAREMGEDVGGLTETTAELFGGLIGITEVLPIASILGKVSSKTDLNTKERLVSALQSGAFEGGQEVAASILQDLTAKGLYSEDLPMADSMFEEFTIGGIIGGAADLVVTSMAGKQSSRRKRLEENNLRSEETKEKLILAKKQEQAVNQGVLEEMQDIPSVTVPQLIPEEELGPEPSVEVIVTPQEQFAVVDISNPEAPVQIDIKEKEIDAIKKRDEIIKDYDFKKLKSKLDDDTYNLGLINSKAAYDLGQSLEDNRASGVSIQDLIDSVPKDSKQEVTLRGLVKDFVDNNPGKTSRSYPRLSMAEAKQLLTAKQFNEFTSAVAQGAFTHSENNGKPSIIADKDTIDTSAKYIKEIAASKNIDLNFQSPAVKYAAEKYTGTPEFNKMKKGQKELFLAKLHALSPFNSRTTFPDFRPRNYTAQEMADFVANAKSDKVIFNKKSLEQIGKDQQFLDDLIYSGRAEQVEGTNNYKIRDNFEFDIARRAEGFNETPEEFGARLTAEGELPAESIADLVEKERTNQENLLPPVEIEPKFINYAETLQEGKVNKFAKELRKRLDGVGLKDTGIVVSDDIISTTTLRRVDGEIKYDPRRLIDPKTGDKARGEYDKNTDTIFISLNAVNPDGGATEVEIIERLRGVLDHEMIHALRAKDLITEAEYQYLKKQVEQQKVPNTNTTFLAQAQSTYSDIAAKTRTSAEATELLYEEAIAELFRKKDLLVNTPPKVDGIFNKIIQFFKTAGQAMRSSGYKSATEIFNNIESGRVGARERGVVRTTRLVDKGLLPINFLGIEERDEVIRTPEPIPGVEIKQTIGPRAVSKRTRIGTTKTPTTSKPPTTSTPPVGPVTSPVPNKIYNSQTMSFAERAKERKFILDGLKKAKVFNPRSSAKGDSVKMMKWLKDNAPNEDYRIIATKVHQSLLALQKLGYDFPLEITKNLKKTKGFRGRISYDRLRPQSFEMRISDKFGGKIPKDEFAMKLVPDSNSLSQIIRTTNGVNFETLLHEGIHQATVPHMEDVSGGPKSRNKKIAKAYKDLANQRKRVEKYIRDRISEFDEGVTNIEAGKLTFDQFISSLPTTLNKSLRRDLVSVYFDNGNLRTKSNIRINKREFEKTLIDYKINGIQKGSRNPDSAEFLTFGLTNRNFQEILESIPTKPGATKSIWNEFVEAIRNILGLPAKLNTELSAFLKNAGVVLDLQAEGVPIAGMDVGDRGVAEEVTLFSRPQEPIGKFTIKKDEFVEGNINVGKILGYDVEIFRDPGGMGGQNYSMIITDPRVDMEIDFKSIGLFSKNLQEAKEDAVDKIQTLINDGEILDFTSTYFITGVGKRENAIIAKLKDTDIPTFSRVPRLNSTALLDFIKQNPEGFTIDPITLESPSSGFAVAPVKALEIVLDQNKMTEADAIQFYNNVADLSEQMDQPVFAGGWLNQDNNKYYLDATVVFDTIEDALYTAEASQQEAIFDLGEFNETTTEQGIQELKDSGRFSSEARRKQETRITELSKLFEETRNRSSQEVADISGDIPTFSRAPSRFPTTQEQINNASQQLLEDSLSYHSNLVYKTERELFQDVLRPDEKITLERRRYNAEAVVAKTERRLEELRTGTGQLPLFSRGPDTSKFIPKVTIYKRQYFPNDPLEVYSQGDIDPVDIDVEDIDALVSHVTEGSRGIKNPDTGVRPLDESILQLTGGTYDKTLVKQSRDFLKKFLNKNNKLVVYRSVNVKLDEDLKNYGQLETDPFASTTLSYKEAQSIGKNVEDRTRKILLDTFRQQERFEKTGDPRPFNPLSSITPGSKFDLSNKQLAINTMERNLKRIQELGLQPQDTDRPASILRYEIPLNRVKLYLPVVANSISDASYEEHNRYHYGLQDGNEISELADEIMAEEGYTTEGKTFEQQIKDRKAYYDAAYEQYRPEFTPYEVSALSEMMRTVNEELEVIADLRGIKPAYQYTELTNTLIRDVPLFSRKRRDDTGTNSQENIQLREALAEAEETVKQTPRGSIPYYNLNASDTALKAAIDFNKDLSATAPDDIPKFSRPTLDGLDNNLQEFIKRTGGEVLPDQSWGARLIEIVKDPITAIKNFFINFRQRYIDQYDTITKTLLAGKTKEFYLGIDERTGKLRINPETKKPYTEEEAIKVAEQITLANMFADAGAEQSIRMSDKSRGVFQGMLTRGIAVDQIDGIDSLVKTIPLELVDADGNKTGKTGGLIQILAPLFSNVDVNLEAVFKSYGILKRAKNLDESGREIDTPVQPNDYALIEQIEQQHPEVVEVYRNYQNWNNSLIELAERKGILSKEQSALWREHSVYYPFYRQMVDDSGIKGPAIAGGSLPGNPLDIKIEGSEEIIDADPIEAISRNSLSILTASLKNDAMGKIVKNLETMGLAKSISAKDAGKADSLFFFEDGIKKHYQVDDPRLVYSLQNIGGVAPGAIGKFLAIPAGLLRDTVTRDPGFVVINILRDTLSSAVTSGAPYTPIVDSVKNMFGSMEELEQFGVLGGYDYSIDEGSVKQFITKTMRQQGLTPNNAMSPTGAFFKLWDGLGALTTKSDGATRKAVYDVVYKQLKEDGYSEALAQSEAAYQAQEIINFGRRGSDPLFRIITAAIPFLNARIQGLDVLHRGLTGKYSAVEKQQIGESLKEIQSRILRRTALNASLLVGLTALYYMMVSDTDEYKNLKREVRDDNWVFPLGNGNAVKIPIPFEVGMLFKAIPERVFDMTMGDDAFTRKSVDEALTSIERQVSTSFNIPFLGPGSGIQLLKPIAEVMNNRNTFTDTEIVPYYQQQKEPGLQARATTNEFARILGESLNISPAKIEHIMRGYTGTLGGYVLAVIDTITRGATGSPLLPSNFELSKMPVFNRLLLDLDKSGGYQQQFYELRGEVDRAVATINSLQKQQRFDELSAYRSNMQGVLNVKGQVRAIERYLDNWRKRRDRLMRDENISVSVKSDMLRELELERDMRLAMVPELRKRANIPVLSLNL